MRLHILRHAETDSFSATGKDIDRRLLPQGIQQGITLKRYFDGISSIERVWSSSSTRTRQTCELALNDQHPKPIFFDDLYLSSMQALLQKIWRFSSGSELLIIGHNFGISDLANYFTDSSLELMTGEYVCIEFACETWEETSKGTGIIVDRYRPTVSF